MLDGTGRRPALFLLLVACSSGTVWTACTGEDPSLSLDGDQQEAGAPGNEAGPGEGVDGSDPSAPTLVLAAEPLTIVTGTSDTLRLRVVERRNVGEVTFRFTGQPEGVTLPSLLKLTADATTLDIPIAVVGSATHGDYVIAVKADGQPFAVDATVVVRGLPGSVDSGFGSLGRTTTKLVPGTDVRIAPLPDGRTIVGWTNSGKIVLYPMDAKGNVGPVIPVTTTGSLRGIAPTPNSGFIVAVVDGMDVRLVPFSPAGVEGTLTTASTSFAGVPQIAASPAGMLFAQVQNTGSQNFLMHQRYSDTAAKDVAFGDIKQNAGQPKLFTATGTRGGSIWTTAETDFNQMALIYGKAGAGAMAKALPPTESCRNPAALDEDLVVYCTNDQPTFELRRYKPDGTTVGTFGTGGRTPVDTSNATVAAVVSNEVDRFYLGYRTKTPADNNLYVVSFDGMGVVRTVFGNSGILLVNGKDSKPQVTVDARGRVLAYDTEYVTATNNFALRVQRFWD